MNKSILPAVLVVGATALAACGNTVTGEATGGSSAAAGASSSAAVSASATVAVPKGLDTGTYATAPRTITSNANSTWIVEGNRMGDEALIQANEVDPRLIIGGGALRSFPVVSLDGLRSRVPNATASAFQDNDIRVGMSTTRGDKLTNPTVAVRIGLYRFDTPEVAAKALDAVREATSSAKKVTIDGQPDVAATEFKPGTVDSYINEGPFVINVSGTGPTTADGAKFVEKAYTLELPKVKAFKATPSNQVSSLDVDKDGILGRTLPYEDETADASLIENWYDYNGLLHRVGDISTLDTYQVGGIDLVGEAGSTVYRAKSPAAATAMVKTSTGKNPPAAGIPALPTVKCMQADWTFCWVPVGRYVGLVSDKSATAARQKAAAQFTILAAAG